MAEDSSSADKAAIVPRFTSFKPKKPVRNEENTTSRKPPHERVGLPVNTSRHKTRHTHGDRGAREVRADSKSAGDVPQREHFTKVDTPREDPVAASLFLEDRQGDPGNLFYAKVHRYSVPKYHARGRGSIIGLSRHLRWKATADDDRRLVSSERNSDIGRSKTRSLLSTIPASEPEAVGIEAGNDERSTEDISKDYVKLEDPGMRKRRRTEDTDFENSDSGSELETPAQSKGGQEKAFKDEADSAADPERADRLRLYELSQAVKAHPQNINSWLALLNYHETKVESADGHRKVRDAERRAQADIRLSIYEEALDKVGQHPEREQLLLGLLNEGTKLWDTRKLAGKWRQFIKENPHYLNLWMGYLDFCQANAIIYSYEKCRDSFLEAMKAMYSSYGPGRERLRISVFLRMTKFMLDSSHSEHAIALWQAILELTYLTPKDVAVETEVGKFAEFWESEVARIGEEGAQGWKTDHGVEVEPKVDEQSMLVDQNNLFRSWALTERVLSEKCDQPARTMDDVSEDDPYRVILFSDLADYLIKPESAVGHDVLFQAFLKFCDLPPCYNNEVTDPWWQDQFLLARVSNGWALSHEESAELHENTTSASALQHTFEPFYGAVDSAALFSTKAWLSCWPKLGNETDPMHLWKQRALRVLAEAIPDKDTVAEYVISYTLQTDAKVARKYAKALLKKRPSSLLLYNSFALIEQRLGDTESAERVWSTTIAMSGELSASQQRNAIILWKTWTWECLDQGQWPKALGLLLAIPDGHVDIHSISIDLDSNDQQHHLRILRTSRHLESHLSDHMASNHTHDSAHYAECLTILRYLSSPEQDLSAALSLYTNPSPALPHPLLDNALLAQSVARLLIYHTTTHPHSPNYRLCTSTLTTLLARHPSNTILLSAHNHLTRHINLFDRLRSSTQSILSSPSTDLLIPTLYKIHLEIQRPTYGGGTKNSIRAAFEAAVSDEGPAAHSPVVWLWYVTWELELASQAAAAAAAAASTSHNKRRGAKAKQEDFSRAVQIYFRGLRAVPWHKEFAMLAFGDERLGKVLGRGELRKVYEGMVERGMRIRVDISEQIEDLGIQG